MSLSSHSIGKRTMADNNIRPARAEEASLLSKLAFRSKTSWGYPSAFMESCRADLTLSADDISNGDVNVVEDQGAIVGFYTLRLQGDTAALTDLWVAPEAMRQGYGKHLLLHALQRAQRKGSRQLTVESDPHAEGFYLAMGAQRIGQTPSSVFPERMLPLLCFSLVTTAAQTSGPPI